MSAQVQPRICQPGDTARQFVVEITENGNSLPDKFKPHVLWVEASVPRSNFPGNCPCEKVYPVVEESVAYAFNKVAKLLGGPTGYYCVCECMGHFVE